MGQGIFQILRLEISGEGLQFGNFFTRAVDIDFSFGEVFLVLIFAMICHLLLMVYIDQAFPGEFSVAKEWYFPFKMCLKVFKTSKVDHEDDYSSLNSDLNVDSNTSPDRFEEEPPGVKIGIQISNLTKVFGTKTSVKKLNLNMLVLSNMFLLF